ncbi:MAG: YoaK family protein, partial [Bdellovibrionota bacterium]
MYRHVLKDRAPPKTIFHWLLLAFLAGSVNAGAFLACGRFVTHVTGFATHFGVDLVEHRYADALGIFAIPLFFILGSTVSGFLVDNRIDHRQEPRYDAVMFLSSFALLLVALGGQFRVFGAFGQTLHIRSDFFLLALLCFAMGLQNAAITSASKGTVRTTHLTGLSTDLGIGLAKLFSTDWANRETLERRLRTQTVRLGTIGSYIAGSVAGALLFVTAHYLGFLLPASLAAYAGAVAWFEEFREP